jgi:hypothetical protein
MKNKFLLALFCSAFLGGVAGARLALRPSTKAIASPHLIARA